jgi:hypothetical protein
VLLEQIAKRNGMTVGKFFQFVNQKYEDCKVIMIDKNKLIVSGNTFYPQQTGSFHTDG